MVCWDLLQKKSNIKNIIHNHHVLLHSYSEFLSSHVGKVMIATSFSSSAGAFGVVKFHDLDDLHHFSSTRHPSSAQLANPAVPTAYPEPSGASAFLFYCFCFQRRLPTACTLSSIALKSAAYRNHQLEDSFLHARFNSSWNPSKTCRVFWRQQN